MTLISADSAPGPKKAVAIDVRALPRVLQRIVGLALRHPWLVGSAIGCSLLSSAAALALPRLFGRGVDQAQHLLAAGAGRDGQSALLHTALFVIVASMARGCLNGLAGYLAETTSQKVAYELRLRYFSQLQRLSFGFHDKIHSGDLITRGMLDLENTRAFIQGGLMQAMTLLLLLGGAGAMMIATDAKMAIVALLFVPLAGYALTRMGVLLRLAWLEVQQLMSALTLVIEENLQGMRVVRAFSAKAYEMARFDRAADLALLASYRRITHRLRASAAMNLSFYCSMALLLWYGGHRVLNHETTVGRLTEFLVYMTLLQAPIRQITMLVASASRTTSAGGRLFEILDLEPEIRDRPNASPLQPEHGVLRFEHVGFAYDAGRPVLHDISFEVGPGRTLGIVGAPGSGKSTIANLIPRFYDATSGRIAIDGQDIRDVTLESLRRHVGLVQQEAFLFDATVLGNVAYAAPDLEEEQLFEAARAAQIHDYVAALPLAYGTRVGERGVALSGGQRQRLSIARGVAPGPGVVIFDDSTAAIDAVTERKVRLALAQATKAKATIIISHRLSALTHADEIIVLDAGRIIERGTHAELLAQGGLYASLHALQTRTGAGEVAAQQASEEIGA